MSLTGLGLVVFGMFWIVGMGVVAGSSEPDFQDNLDTIGCTEPGQTDYEQENGIYNWNKTSQTMLYDCSNVKTFGVEAGGCGQTPPNGCDYYYGSPAVQIGWFFYASDVISRTIESGSAFSDIANAAETPTWTLLGMTVDTGQLAIIFMMPSVMVAIGIFMILRGVS